MLITKSWSVFPKRCFYVSTPVTKLLYHYTTVIISCSFTQSMHIELWISVYFRGGKIDWSKLMSLFAHIDRILELYNGFFNILCKSFILRILQMVLHIMSKDNGPNLALLHWQLNASDDTIKLRILLTAFCFLKCQPRKVRCKVPKKWI